MTFTQAELKLIARGLEAVHRQGSRAAKRRKDPFPPGTVQDMYGQEADRAAEMISRIGTPVTLPHVSPANLVAPAVHTAEKRMTEQQVKDREDARKARLRRMLEENERKQDHLWSGSGQPCSRRLLWLM